MEQRLPQANGIGHGDGLTPYEAHSWEGQQRLQVTVCGDHSEEVRGSVQASAGALRRASSRALEARVNDMSTRRSDRVWIGFGQLGFQPRAPPSARDPLRLTRLELYTN